MARWTVDWHIFLLFALPRWEPSLLSPGRGSVVLLLSFIVRSGVPYYSRPQLTLDLLVSPAGFGRRCGKQSHTFCNHPPYSFFYLHPDFSLIPSFFVAFFDSVLTACPVFDRYPYTLFSLRYSRYYALNSLRLCCRAFYCLRFSSERLATAFQSRLGRCDSLTPPEGSFSTALGVSCIRVAERSKTSLGLYISIRQHTIGSCWLDLTEGLATAAIGAGGRSYSQAPSPDIAAAV